MPIALKEVRRLAKNARIHEKRALREFCKATGCSPSDGERAIRSALGSLEGTGFCQTVQLNYPSPGPFWADVYGITLCGRSWYVKFYVHAGVMEIVSFHPPESPMQTQAGTLKP